MITLRTAQKETNVVIGEVATDRAPSLRRFLPRFFQGRFYRLSVTGGECRLSGFQEASLHAGRLRRVGRSSQSEKGEM